MSARPGLTPAETQAMHNATSPGRPRAFAPCSCPVCAVLAAARRTP